MFAQLKFLFAQLMHFYELVECEKCVGCGKFVRLVWEFCGPWGLWGLRDWGLWVRGCSRIQTKWNEMKPKCVNWNWEIPSNSQPFIAFEMSYNVRYFFFYSNKKIPTKDSKGFSIWEWIELQNYGLFG